VGTPNWLGVASSGGEHPRRDQGVRVNWRAVLPIMAGMLLPLPLVLLLSGALRPEVPEVEPSGRRVSPVLSAEERERLTTYRRDCGSGQPCEFPLGCLVETRARRHLCIDSQCSKEVPCPEGQVCRELATVGDGPLVRICVPVGVRQEGEACTDLPSTQEGACASGLLCGSGRRRWCARPCRKDDAEACSEGYFCANTAPEPLCLPTCQERGCPEEQQCIQHEEGVSACAEVYGPSCQQTPCSRGSECQVTQRFDRPGKVWLECVERCGEGYPPCSAGLVCDSWLCRAPCDPQGPNLCMEGYLCRQAKPHRPYTCQPESFAP